MLLAFYFRESFFFKGAFVGCSKCGVLLGLYSNHVFHIFQFFLVNLIKYLVKGIPVQENVET